MLKIITNLGNKICPAKAEADETPAEMETPTSPPQPGLLHGCCSSSKIFGYLSGGMMMFTGTVIVVVTEVTPVVIANYSATGGVILQSVGGIAGGALFALGGVSIGITAWKK
jgi:hypothetical protein